MDRSTRIRAQIAAAIRELNGAYLDAALGDELADPLGPMIEELRLIHAAVAQRAAAGDEGL